MVRHTATIIAALICAQMPPLAHAQQRPPTVSELHGTLTARNFRQLETFVSRHRDKVIGLKISVDKSGENDPLQASDSQFDATHRQLAIYMRDNTTAEIVSTGGYRFEQGSYVFDGLYLVKSGGIHQGVTSYGLVKTDEGRIRPGGHKIQRVQLRP